MQMQIPNLELLLEIALVVLMAVTVFHAIRLERTLGFLKRDRAALETLIASFNESTRHAEAGIKRLHETADGAGQQIARQLDAVNGLKDDLSFLTERGERLADRLDLLVRAARPLAAEPTRPPPEAEPAPVPRELPKPRTQAERDLLRALRLAR